MQTATVCPLLVLAVCAPEELRNVFLSAPEELRNRTPANEKNNKPLLTRKEVQKNRPVPITLLFYNSARHEKDMWTFKKMLYQQQARLLSLHQGVVGPSLALASGTTLCWLLYSRTRMKDDVDDENNHHGTKEVGRSIGFPSAVAATTGVSFCESSSLLLSPPPSATLQKRPYETSAAAGTTADNNNDSFCLDVLYDIPWHDKPLGEGTYGTVFFGRHRETGTAVAVKKIPKRLTSHATFQREMKALMQIKAAGGHSSICWMQEHFDQGPYFYLILELIQGSELFEHLCEIGSYSEASCAQIVRGMASALHFLHGIGIVHCDLKPENLMLVSCRQHPSEQPQAGLVKLVDFGCAQFLAPNTAAGTTTNDDSSPFLNHDDEHNKKRTEVTVAYCPPEVLHHKKMTQQQQCHHHTDNMIDPSFDLWSLGIIMYIMLTGIHPFDLDCCATNEEIEARILSGKKPPIRNSEYTAHLSKDAIDLLDGLIEWDPNKRLTAEQLLQNRWVLGEMASTK